MCLVAETEVLQRNAKGRWAPSELEEASADHISVLDGEVQTTHVPISGHECVLAEDHEPRTVFRSVFRRKPGWIDPVAASERSRFL